MNRLLGELNDGARLDVAAGADMVCKPGYGWAECAPFSVVVSVDDNDRFLDACADNKLPDTSQLRCIQCEFRRTLWTHHAKHMEPTVHHPHLDQSIDPSVVQGVVNIALANARANTGHDFVVEAILKPFHRLAQYAVAPSTRVAHDLRTLDADQRRHVAELPQSFGHFVGDKVTVGEDLEIRIGMCGQNIEQLFVHERFATEDAEERIAHRFCLCQRLVHGGKVDFGLLGSHIDPATLASQIACVDN